MMHKEHMMEPMHDEKAMNTSMSKTVGRIKETVVKRRKAKKSVAAKKY